MLFAMLAKYGEKRRKTILKLKEYEIC